MSNNNDKIVRVITAVVDTRELTLYLEDGNTFVIKQGDPRVKRIVDEITPILVKGGVAEVNLDYDKTTEFAKFEEKTNGVIKLFRVAKEKLKSFLNRTEMLYAMHVPPQEIKPAETQDTTEAAKLPEGAIPVKELTPEERMKQATDDILKHAVPVTSHHFADHQVGDNEKHALVAVVEDKVVPNVQHLHSQIRHVNEGGDSEGLTNLIKRVSKVKRGHSVDDLMKFLKHGDLPIAKDGSIIIYKRLRGVSEPQGDYVDVHSGKVFQRVGDFVHMPEDMVDPNRRQDCSHGLHVARRQYLGGFSGNKMIIASVAPEDVIAVPQYDANKMRVCGYHILFEVPEKDANKLNSNQPIKPEDETAKLLAHALAGEFPPPRRDVLITGREGAGVVYTDLGEKAEVAKTPDLAPVGAIEDQAIIDPAMQNGERVDPAKVVDEVVGAIQEQEPVKPLSRTEQVSALLLTIQGKFTNAERLAAAQELQALRKKWKQSWASINVQGGTQLVIEKLLATDPNAPAVKHVPKKAASSKKSAVPPKAAGGAQKPAKAVKDVPVPKAQAAAPTGPVGPSARIAALIFRAVEGEKASAEEIVKIKRAAKKSWAALGVNDVQLYKLEQALKK